MTKPKQELITISEPLPGSKLRRQWTAIVGGVEFVADSEAEACEKAFNFVMNDPVISNWFKVRLAAEVAYLQAELREWSCRYAELAKRTNILEHRMGQISMILRDDIEGKPIRDF
jgi:hypothetical protein